MTKLEFAFAEAAKLPLQEQNALADMILEEIASEKRWAAQFAASQGLLSKMAAEAVEEYLDGKTEPLDPAKL